ncbi:MAG: protein kinase [Planctomycetales bacterium]|nr:protein kinase [Planctomycetales bacterium]
MSGPTAEQFAQRAFDTGVLDERQLDAIWAEFGTRGVDLDEFRNVLLRRELLTNYQVEKLTRGDRSGFFFGDYKVLYLVGTGTFARVFRAVNTSDGRVVAVKVLRSRWSADPEKTEQFLREGRMGAQLRHPCIVPIYEVHSIKKEHFLVMEFVEGQNLRQFVRMREKVETPQALQLAADMCSGLAYAADQGVTHRDMKLSNVLVSSRGKGQLVDFGLAAFDAGDDSSSGPANPRTIDYAALERATGVRKDDLRSDIYFAGCILYHMLTGQAPLRETRDRTQRLSITRFEEILPITAHLPDLPAPVVAIVSKAMDLNPTRRYQTPAEMVVDLKLAARRIEEAAAHGITLPSAAEVGAATHAETAAQPVAHEGEGKTVMVVESSIKMQDMLRDALKKFGYRVLVISDPARALARFQDHPAADCVLFSTHELGKEALDTFNEFGVREQTSGTAALLLLAEKQQGWEALAQRSEHRGVMSMPIRGKQLRETLQRLIRKA